MAPPRLPEFRRLRAETLQILVGAALVTAIGAVTLGPVLFVLLSAVEADSWKDIFSNTANENALGYSFLLSLRAPFAALVGFLIAWMLIRLRMPFARFIEFSMWIAFFLPLLPVTLSWILLLDPRYGVINTVLSELSFMGLDPFDIYSVGGIFWVHIVASSVPVMVVILGPALRQLDSSFEEAARTCGASPLGLFRRITLPILAPAILTGALAAFIRSLESFEVEQLLGRPAGIDVYSTRIYDLMSWEPPQLGQTMALSSIVLGVLFLVTATYTGVFRNYGYATVSSRSTASHQLDLGRLGYVLSAALMILVVLTVYLPLGSLVVGSFMRLFGFFQISSPFTGQHWQTVLHDPLFLDALSNSLMLALAAGVLGILLYSSVGYIIVRGGTYGRRIMDLLCWLPWLIPGLLLGVSLLSLILSFPHFGFLYGSVASLAVVIIVAQLPIGVHMMKTSIGQISGVLEQSSRVCGAGPSQTFVRIVVPLIRPMMVSIFTIVFIAAMRDIGTIIFLTGAGNQTLSVLALQFALSSNLEGAAVIGVITTVIVILVALSARRLGLQVVRV